MKYEILAPAGGMESLIAGVRSGANAVYLGGKLFNARRNAGNFDNTELTEAVSYCHARNVKVYLTLNILVSDEEIESAYYTVKNALTAGVDGFIVQDLGIAKMIKAHFPNARLHGSTQMSILSPAGARAAEKLGFSRIVLPREMTLTEIEEIRKATDLELEIFVHGALCMSVSGQCYLSSMLGSRSGNRGLCAQPCRLPFTAKADKNECALSLKDLSLISQLDKLDGITSLKIEGRMKRPEYVAAAVTAVKKAIEGTVEEQDFRLLRSVFSRSGFTDGYLTSARTDMFGTRQKEDVVLAKEVLGKIKQSYSRETPLVPISFSFTCRENRPAALTASAFGRTVTVTTDAPEKALHKPMTQEDLAQRLAKLGGTQFYPEKISIDLDEGLILPVSKINALRREAVADIVKEEHAETIALPYVPASASVTEKKIQYVTASFRNAAQIPNHHPFKYVFLPADSTLEDFVDNRAGVVLPRGLFGIEEKLKKRLETLRKAGVTRALCGNLGSYALAKEMGFTVFGDFGLNVYNSLTAQMLENPILSFELTTAQIKKINAENTGAVLYGRLPLMLTRNCPVKNSIGCGACGGHGALTDRKGISFPVLCGNTPSVEILNSVPLYMLDRMNELAVDFGHFYFSTESISEVKEIINLYTEGASYEGKYTRGLYYRQVK